MMGMMRSCAVGFWVPQWIMGRRELGIGKCVTWCMNTTWNHGKKGIFETASDHGRVRELVKQGRGRVMYSGLVGIQGLMGRREFWTLQRIVSEVEGYGNDEVM